MLDVRYQSRFKRDLRLLSKRGYDLKQLYVVVDMLQAEQPLPEKYRNHQLSGNWIGHYECHITGDWLLIYKIDGQELILTLTRTGTHADLLNM